MFARRPTQALVFLLATLGAGPAAFAGLGSLYRGPDPRPGPDLLYAAPGVAAQLTNAGVWSADPILVSGASAYRRGEFLYQDFLYDDHGANSGVRDPGDPRTSGDTFSGPNGTYTYPTAAVYAGNAADLVELRVKPLADATAFRVTLNTLNDPTLVAFTIAIGDSAAPLPFPHGADASAPAALFLTVHGSAADLVDATSGLPAPVPPTVSVDTTRRQLEVRVPHADWDPTGQVVRLAMGVGLWDVAGGRYLLPLAAADASHPGGAGVLPTPCAFFNVAFRHQEPMPQVGDLGGDTADVAWWRDSAQGTALRTGELSPFAALVDFAKLAAGVADDLVGRPEGVPQTGPMDRILASHFETKPGTDYSVTCGAPGVCLGELRGQLQPYAIYVPNKPVPPNGFPLTPLLHSLSANYNQYLGSRNQSEFGERAAGSIVITPEARGPDAWYYDYGDADVFEVWADVAARFALDPDDTVITGYSMGGYGTYKLAVQYPDLFAKGQPTVGPPAVGIWVPPAPPFADGGPSTQSLTFRQLASLRSIPFLLWNASTDELVPLPGPVAQANGFDALGYRYEIDIFAPAEHLTLAFNDQYQPAADFLGMSHVDRNPPHVTYVVNPTMDFPNVGTVADHAYWLSGLRLRDASGDAPLGAIDARSEGFGTGDPTPNPTQQGAGTLTGGNLPALAFTSQSRTWGPVPATPRANVLHVTLQNVATVHVAIARAALDPTRTLTLAVTADGDGTLALDGAFPASSVVLENGVPVPGASAGPNGAVIPLTAGTHTFVIAHGLHVRRR